MCGFPAAHLPHFQTRPRRQKGITTERFSSIPFSSCCSILSCHPSCQTDLPSGPRPLVESLPSRRSRSLDRRRQPPRRFSPLRRWFHSPRRSPPSSADRYSPPQWRPSLDRSPAPALRDPVAGPGVSPRSHRKALLRSLLHWSSPQGRQAPLLPRFLARSRQSAMDSRRLECPLPRHCPATSSAFPIDRKSTRLNSSHTVISYAVFCLKKKKITTTDQMYL